MVALDLDTSLLDDLRAAPHVTVLEEDLAKSPLKGRGFDLVHTRNLLMHLEDRDRILSELVECTRPGGVLVIEEADGFPALASTDPIFRRTVEPLTRRWKWARALPMLMSGLGLVDLSVFVETEMLQGGSDLAAFWHYTIRTADPALVEAGVHAADVRRTLELLEDPSFWTPFMAVVCVTGKRSTNDPL